MHCLVTAGPTAEALDQVRRLTNVSSGRLGIGLANHLAARGHAVTLFLGQLAAWSIEAYTGPTERFSSAADLSERLQEARTAKVDALFHAAAVSDFTFGKVWARAADGSLSEVRAGKFSTRDGTLLAELVPTPKIIAHLREWFAAAVLIGWKYEVDGNRATAVGAAEEQLLNCQTDACVINGPAYGGGFGLVTGPEHYAHLGGSEQLFAALEAFIRR